MIDNPSENLELSGARPNNTDFCNKYASEYNAGFN